MDAQHLAQTTHSMDGLGLRLSSNSEPSRAALGELETSPVRVGAWKPWRWGAHPDQPARSHRCLSVKVLGPELSTREGAREQAALLDPTQAAHVPRPCRRAHPMLASSGGLCSSASLARAQSRLSAAVPLPALPAPPSNSPALAPGKVWWCGDRGGQAAGCSAAAAAAGARRQPAEEAGRRGRSRAGGGQRGGTEGERRRPRPHQPAAAPASSSALPGPPQCRE